MLGFIVFIAVVSILVGIRNGASIYRMMFDLAIIGGIGVLFLLPLVLMGESRAVGRAAWVLPVVMIYYLVMMVCSVRYITNRGKFYEWVIRKLR